jgi:hypothetical protein
MDVFGNRVVNGFRDGVKGFEGRGTGGREVDGVGSPRGGY